MLEEEFLKKPFLYLMFCKTYLGISVTTSASVNPMGHGFKMATLSAREAGKANYSARHISKKK